MSMSALWKHKYKKKQRYIFKVCGPAFNTTTAAHLENTKSSFSKHMIRGLIPPIF